MTAFQQHLAFKRRLVLNFALPLLFAAVFTAQFEDFIDSPTQGWLLRFCALVVAGMLTYHVGWFFLRVIKKRKRQDR